MSHTEPQPHFFADLTFVTPFTVGEPPINFSFRGELDLGIAGMHHMAYIVLNRGHDSGISIQSGITLLFPEYQVGRMKPDEQFTVHSGPQLIARGSVTEIIDEVLRA